jgi:SprT-like family
MLNARCFGNELPKHPQIVVCGSSDDSLVASSRAWYTTRRRVYARICIDPSLDAPSFELLPDERLRAVLIHEMAHVRVRLNGDYDPKNNHGPAWKCELIRIATLYNEAGLLEQVEQYQAPWRRRPRQTVSPRPYSTLLSAACPALRSGISFPYNRSG